ncbi:UPF0481 protein At3g47200-like [Durio zibethinus]|uniref:UPF0481 protein At3g47200-like n=1 Tax=Durio zibethinus TaxID=66656 RepID=A0A6P5X3I1_DURZI|nr:UPF0481 protein At3g47200-like [Durio zibethinus]
MECPRTVKIVMLQVGNPFVPASTAINVDLVENFRARLLEDRVSVDIRQMLANLSENSPEPCIFKVPNYIRQENEKAYEPQVISIGPYHRGKDHLKAMEEQKLRILQKLLEERKGIGLLAYVRKMSELEDQARKCYAENVRDLDAEDLVKVLLLDGVFIVQLIRTSFEGWPNYLNDIVDCYENGLWNPLLHDMLLVENQLPFFVLWELFYIIESSWAGQDMIFMLAIYVILDDKAPELKDAGIKFKLADGNTNTMFDIWFENGTLHIPQICVEDYTESFLRNLIAYEQLFLADRDLNRATDYMYFMDYLIDSPKDVGILCQHGIIKNMLGDDKAVATMINGLSCGVTFSPSFHYTEVFNKINEHRSKRWNSWMANLKHNHFNSPWAFVSFLAAALLLLLTLLQTVKSKTRRKGLWEIDEVLSIKSKTRRKKGVNVIGRDSIFRFVRARKGERQKKAILKALDEGIIADTSLSGEVIRNRGRVLALEEAKSTREIGKLVRMTASCGDEVVIEKLRELDSVGRQKIYI